MKNENELCNKIFLTNNNKFFNEYQMKNFLDKNVINIGDSSIFVFSELPVK